MKCWVHNNNQSLHIKNTFHQWSQQSTSRLCFLWTLQQSTSRLLCFVVDTVKHQLDHNCHWTTHNQHWKTKPKQAEASRSTQKQAEANLSTHSNCTNVNCTNPNEMLSSQQQPITAHQTHYPSMITAEYLKTFVSCGHCSRVRQDVCCLSTLSNINWTITVTEPTTTKTEK